MISKPDSYPIVEEFYTLQGEGYFSGQAAYFIRIAGCDVGCPWCDTKVSWDAGRHRWVEVKKLVKNAAEFSALRVVITGGEPLMYQLDPLCTGLKDAGIQTSLETSGAYPLSGKWDWICLSPKTYKEPLPEIFRLANELKMVIANKDDLEWAVENSKKVDDKCLLYLQPEWSVFRNVSDLIVDFVKENPKWRVSLQTHKFMRIP
ncbi:MAG: 7-carboxy-7-deazaguanine synthase QueE [Bacteroidales bacterium]|nr:7-carboxy-7-deazaguanine synthase QueE [Bacteroidales bacterium]